MKMVIKNFHIHRSTMKYTQFLAQFMADTTRYLAKAVLRIPRPNERVEHLGCSLCDFSSHHFRSFEGIEGPNVVEAWLTNIEVLFNTLGCNDE
jgi:Uri superfamily endonuclease